MCEYPEVCVCLKISLKEIIDAIENGAKDIETVQSITKAGTVCKMCVSQEYDVYGERDIHISELLK